MVTKVHVKAVAELKAMGTGITAMKEPLLWPESADRLSTTMTHQRRNDTAAIAPDSEQKPPLAAAPKDAALIEN